MSLLKLESLEGRDVPAADVFFDGPNLVIAADYEDDAVFISEADGLVFLNVNGVDYEPLPRDAVGLITFYGDGGNDTFVNATSAYAIAYGGYGHDVLVGGNFGNALVGESGSDILVGGFDSDILLGERGNDILLGGPGADVLYGGTGFDQFLGIEPFDVIDDSGIVFFDDGYDDFYGDDFDGDGFED